MTIIPKLLQVLNHNRPVARRDDPLPTQLPAHLGHLGAGNVDGSGNFFLCHGYSSLFLIFGRIGKEVEEIGEPGRQVADSQVPGMIGYLTQDFPINS